MLEWKKLREIAEFKKGRSLSKSDLSGGPAPVILYGELYTTYGNYINEVVSKTSIEINNGVINNRFRRPNYNENLEDKKDTFFNLGNHIINNRE